MILTTIKSGLHWPAHTPSGQFEQQLRNEQRIERWQEQVARRERQGAAEAAQFRSRFQKKQEA